jgi:hypothetical protein
MFCQQYVDLFITYTSKFHVTNTNELLFITFKSNANDSFDITVVVSRTLTIFIISQNFRTQH